MKLYCLWLAKWRWWVVLVFVSVLGLTSIGALQLEFTTNFRVFFSENNPQLADYRKLQNKYTKSDNVLFVLLPDDGNVFTRKTLAAIESLTRAAWKLPYCIRVDSVTNFQYSYAKSDSIFVEPLVKETVALGETDLATIKSIALKEPLLLGRLISSTGDVTGVNVTVEIPPGMEREAVPEIAKQARHLAKIFRVKNPAVDVRLTGIVMMDSSLKEVPLRDMERLVPLMFGIVAAVLALLIRNLAAVGAALFLIMLVIGTTMGMAGWYGLLLSPPAAVVPIIIMTIALADSVHVLVNYQDGLASGLVKQRALINSLRINFQPIFLTSLTTIIGFLGLNFSDVPPFRDLGNLVAIGTALAFVLSISFLPALLLILPIPKTIQNVRTRTIMKMLGNFVVHRRIALLCGTGAVGVLLVSFIPKNQFNDEFINYFDHSVEFRRATDITIDRLTGLYMLEFEVDGGRPERIVEPELLATVDAFTHWFRQQREVMHVNTVTDILKRINENLHDDAPGFYKLPETRGLAAQGLLLYEMSLPYGLDLNNRINVEKSATRFSVSLVNLSSSAMLALVKRAQNWFEVHALSDLTLTPSGTPLMFAHISERNTRSMLAGTSLALIGISMILIVVFRSVKIGLVSLLPNLAPAALAFGLWGLLVGQVGMTLAVVSCMTLGIVVDDSIHFLSNYLRFTRNQGMDSGEAIRSSFSSVGTALLITSAILMAGFLVLSFSAFTPNADMGLLTTITIAFALIADFLILPPLLILFDE